MVGYAIEQKYRHFSFSCIGDWIKMLSAHQAQRICLIKKGAVVSRRSRLDYCICSCYVGGAPTKWITVCWWHAGELKADYLNFGTVLSRYHVLAGKSAASKINNVNGLSRATAVNRRPRRRDMEKAVDVQMPKWTSDLTYRKTQDATYIAIITITQTGWCNA